MRNFEFDPQKNRLNKERHGLDFRDAQMKNSFRKKSLPKITAEEFDRRVEKGEDVFDYFDWKNAKLVAVKRVNIDFPDWMVKRLDREAKKLNISRQAVVKMWIHDRIQQKK